LLELFEAALDQGLEFLNLCVEQPVIGVVARSYLLVEMTFAVDLECGSVEVEQVINIADVGVVNQGVPAVTEAAAVIDLGYPAVFAFIGS